MYLFAKIDQNLTWCPKMKHAKNTQLKLKCKNKKINLIWNINTNCNIISVVPNIRLNWLKIINHSLVSAELLIDELN